MPKKTDFPKLIEELRGFAEGSESARATLMRDAADALESLLRVPANLEIVNGWLVERGAHELDYPAGPEYGPYPYSDAEPLVHLSEMAGWPKLPEPELEYAIERNGQFGSWREDREGAISAARDWNSYAREMVEASQGVVSYPTARVRQRTKAVPAGPWTKLDGAVV